MPRRTDLHRILVIGSGPIVIGQAAEFDYSGTQAARALREEGYEVILVNSNPATIMTDPEIARPDVHRAGHGGVRRARDRSRRSPTRCCRRWAGRRRSTSRWRSPSAACSSKYGVELIGAKARAIKVAEDRA